MVKHGNNPRGKSDKHQAHNKKYASTHLEETLERWFKKVTTPKATKPKKQKIVLNVNNTTITQEDLARAKEIRECVKAFKRSERKRKAYFIRKNRC